LLDVRVPLPTYAYITGRLSHFESASERANGSLYFSVVLITAGSSDDRVPSRGHGLRGGRRNTTGVASTRSPVSGKARSNEPAADETFLDVPSGLDDSYGPCTTTASSRRGAAGLGFNEPRFFETL